MTDAVASEVLQGVTAQFRHVKAQADKTLHRQLVHYAYHAGQIILLARLRRSGAWQSLSIPHNRSAAFDAAMAKRHGSAA